MSLWKQHEFNMKYRIDATSFKIVTALWEHIVATGPKTSDGS
jgi:hypothetical protein